MAPKQCNPCREQNLECTGDEPECKRCASSGKQGECLYPPPPKRRTKLAKRRACEPCKRKKRKCDGIHPRCGTCDASGSTCTWDNSHLRPSGKLRKIKPLEPGPSETGETQRLQDNPPVASTSYLPLSPRPRDPSLGYDAIATDVHGMNYLHQPLQPPMMLLDDPFFQAGLVDPPFFAASDISPSDLNPNFPWIFQAHNVYSGTVFARE